MTNSDAKNIQISYPKSKTSPWINQLEAWRRQAGHDGYYYAMDMGVGKSKAAIDYANGHDANTVLIICPKKVMPVWPDQFDTHSFADYYPLIFEKDIPIRKKAQIIEDKYQYAKLRGKRLAVILNYDAFWRPPLGHDYDGKTNRILKRGLLTRLSWDLLICDEAHRLMSPGSQSSWGAARLRGVCARRLLLSGTPMPNPLAVYGQFRVLDPSVYGTSFVAFRSRYCVMGGYQNKQILKFINQAELSAKFYSRAYRVTRDQVLQLPEAMHEYRYCDISPWARRIYNEIRKDFVSEVIHKNLGGGEMSAKNALVKILRLSQIAGGYVKLDDGRELIQDHSKIETAVEIIEDLPPDEPVVVFCRWSNEIRRLRGQLNKIGRTNGEVSSAANDMESWKRGNLGVLVVQIQTGSEGVDFTRACYQIYLSIGHISPTIYDQSLSRVHRPGQTRKVIYYHIVAKDTIDEEIYRALKLKMDITQYVLGIIKDQHAIANHRPSSRLVTR